MYIMNCDNTMIIKAENIYSVTIESYPDGDVTYHYVRAYPTDGKYVTLFKDFVVGGDRNVPESCKAFLRDLCDVLNRNEVANNA